MNGYVKCFDINNRHLNLLVHDKKFLIQWDKIRNLLKNGFDSGPVYKYIKTKTNVYNNRVIEYIQVFSITKYQKIMNIVLVYL